MSNREQPEQRRIVEVTPKTLSRYEGLLRQRDVNNVRGVVGFLNQNSLGSYLVGSVVNNANEEYVYIDMLGVGDYSPMLGAASRLGIGLRTGIKIGAQYFGIIDLKNRHEEKTSELVDYRALLIPNQNFWGRLFCKRAEIDLSLMTNINFRELQFRGAMVDQPYTLE